MLIKESNNPRVSVIIPTYKRPEFIEKAITNVISQSYTNIEIIIVDDNGKDTDYWEQTKEIVQRLSTFKKNIIYIENEKNYGIGKTRNIGIENSSGEFITFLDDDDNLDVSKIEKQIALFDAYDMVLSCAREIESSNIIGRFNRKDIYLIDLIHNLKPVGIAASVMFRKDIFKKIQYSQELKYAEDYDFFLNVANAGFKIGYLDQPLYLVNNSSYIDRLTQKKKNFSVEELEESALVIKKNKEILGDRYYKKGLARVYLYNIHKRNNKIKYLRYSINRIGFYYTLLELIQIMSRFITVHHDDNR